MLAIAGIEKDQRAIRPLLTSWCILFTMLPLPERVLYAERAMKQKFDKAVAASGMAPGSTPTATSSLRHHVCDKVTTAKVLTLIALFFFTTYTPALRIENQHLIDAFALRGVKLPNRRKLVEELLPQCYDLKRGEMLLELSTHRGTYQIATDGWKRKAAEKGAPLINFVILLPDGRSKMWTVISAEGEKKDAAWIAKTCTEVYRNIQKHMGPGAVCTGFIMDNTKANLKAMELLEEDFPFMMCLGCAAHSLSLLMKDFDKRLTWLHETYELCTKISNMANAVEAMKAALHDCMRSLNNNVVRSIASYTETRFGSKHFVLRDVLKNLDAMTRWVTCDAYVSRMSAAKAPVDAREIRRTVLGADTHPAAFKDSLTRACELIDPVMDILHEVEGDKPYLSQLLPIMDKVVNNVRDFADKYPALAVGAKITRPGHSVEVSMYEISSSRMDFIYRPCMSLAFLLDPANFVLTPTGEFTAPFAKLAPSVPFERGLELRQQRMKDAADVVENLGGAAAKAEFQRYQLHCFNDPNVVVHLKTLTTRTERTLPGGKIVLQMADMSVRRNLWHAWLSLLFPELAKIAVMLLSMHTTSCAAERNWSKFGLMFAKNRARLARERAVQMIFLTEHCGQAGFEECDVFDLS